MEQESLEDSINVNLSRITILIHKIKTLDNLVEDNPNDPLFIEQMRESIFEYRNVAEDLIKELTDYKKNEGDGIHPVNFNYRYLLKKLIEFRV